ncbi:hypothetical protein [Streptomyces sp. b84]|uniref:hypothetical protein n=1 Tax=Streptomyces sp. b84 TaxID=1827631 RepID=UPI0015CEF8DA|nr:hypothetical protein [Streptomyces sp. b84]
MAAEDELGEADAVTNGVGDAEDVDEHAGDVEDQDVEDVGRGGAELAVSGAAASCSAPRNRSRDGWRH